MRWHASGIVAFSVCTDGYRPLGVARLLGRTNQNQDEVNSREGLLIAHVVENGLELVHSAEPQEVQVLRIPTMAILFIAAAIVCACQATQTTAGYKAANCGMVGARCSHG